MVFVLAFTVTDVKHYAYCPVIIYINHVLGYRETATEYMEMGKEVHEEKFVTPLIAKYKPKKVIRNPFIECESIGLKGSPDIVLLKDYGVAIIAEIKWAEPFKGRVKRDHRLQLGSYAMLIMCTWKLRVSIGALYYLRPEPRILEVKITGRLLREVKRVLDEMKKIIKLSEPPEPNVPWSRCSGCNYTAFCPYYPRKPRRHLSLRRGSLR